MTDIAPTYEVKIRMTLAVGFSVAFFHVAKIIQKMKVWLMEHGLLISYVCEAGFGGTGLASNLFYAWRATCLVPTCRVLPPLICSF